MGIETIPHREVSSPGRPKDLIAPLSIFALAALIFGIVLAIAVHNPFFGGDAGMRLHMANGCLIRMGNRVWLPMLQGHIWVFYLLHLPYYAFRLIPCFYSFVAAVFLGLFAWRRTAKLSGGLIFTLFLVFSFACQWEILNLSEQLYQEAIGLAFFFVLLWAGALELKPHWWLLPIAAGALLTREDFWIYLFAMTLLNYRQIRSQKPYRRSFLLLWSVPALWLFGTFLLNLRARHRLPIIPTEWPLGINKAGDHAISNLAASLADCFQSLVRSRSIYLVVGLLIVWIIGRFLGRANPRSAPPGDDFEARFRPFSFLSLSIIYFLVIVFNPWEHTSGSGRIAIPLLVQGFVWAIVLFARTDSYATPAKILARCVLAAALLLGVNTDSKAWTFQRDRQAEASVDRIAQLVQSAGQSGKPNACVLERDYWEALRLFAAPTLYAQWSPQPKRDMEAGNCDLIILPASSALVVPEKSYTKHSEYQFRGRSYTLFLKSGVRTE